MKKKTVAILCATTMLVGAASSARAGQSPDAFATFTDAVLGRPLGLAATILGGATFVAVLPFAATSGSIGSTADSLVGKPGRFTFTRPLGDFSYPRPHSRDEMARKHSKHQVKRAQTPPAPKAPATSLAQR